MVADGELWEIGPFEVEFIPATHSVPQGMATAFHTPQGTIVHTGDFKIDLTPVDGRLADLSRIVWEFFEFQRTQGAPAAASPPVLAPPPGYVAVDEEYARSAANPSAE